MPIAPPRLTRAFSLASLVAIAGVLIPGCPAPTPPLAPLALEDGCNPLLGGVECTLPYPSDVFRTADPSTPSGARVELTGAARVLNGDGYDATATRRRRYDGFSRVPTITFVLGAPIARGDMIDIFGDGDGSLLPAHPTVLLEADTGTPVPHFVDLDARADDPARTAVQIRPLVPLKETTRYVVGIHTVVGPDGTVAPAPEGFARLRDGTAHPEGPLAALAARYDADVFAPLAAHGVARADLQLAWDFTTGTDVDVMADMLRMRALVRAALEDSPPVVHIDSVVDHERAASPAIARTIKGTLTGPLVMTDDSTTAELYRDADGVVALNGQVTFPFTAQVPWSVADRYAPGMTVQFGHGFFGTQEEAEGTSTTNLMNVAGAVYFALDWWGFSRPDLGNVISAFGGNDQWNAMRFTDRVHQGMANALTLSAALEQGILGAEDAFHRPDTGAYVHENPAASGETNAGALFYNPDHLHAVGISLGHIMTGVLAALNPRIERVAIQVGGASFTHMMSRAQPFKGFLFVLGLSIPDPLERQKLIATLQRSFDRVDPGIYAPYIVGKALPIGPEATPPVRDVLMQYGLSDTFVPNFASALHARALGLSLTTPSVREPWGIPKADAPTNRGLTIIDYGFDEAWTPIAEPPETENSTHHAVRRTPEARVQVRTFLETGLIEHPCDGPCRLPSPL